MDWADNPAVANPPVQTSMALDTPCEDWRVGVTIDGCPTCGERNMLCDICERELVDSVGVG